MSRDQTAVLQWQPSRVRRWGFLVILILLAWGLRLVFLETVPPGWRDDELINIYALSGELFDGRFPLYFTGASGHEPLYHNLHAGLHALAGYNVLTGHLLSVFLATLSVVLTYVLFHRLFGFLMAALAALGLTFSFWSLMYSRIALRHISLVPLALITFYFLWIPLTSGSKAAQWKGSGSWTWTLRWALPLGLALGLSLYTYPAARVLPFILIAFAAFLALFHRPRYRRAWRGYALALVVSIALALPLALAIAQGSSEAAAQGIGADARLVELARPIRALREGDLDPLLDTIWVTLNMFHATGDPEALYNIPDRSVFNLIGGILFWAGVLLCLIWWRRPRHFFLLLWLGFGFLPTVLSVPPASLSHSILVQPLAYLLPLLALREGYRLLLRRFAPGPAGITRVTFVAIALLVFLIPTAYRDLRDYFVRWPADGYVRFLYRADYRDVAQYMDGRLDIQDWAVGSLLMGPWDRLALEADARRDDTVVRLFDPRRAVLHVGGAPPASIVLTSYPQPSASVERLLREDAQGGSIFDAASLSHYLLEPVPVSEQETPLVRFADGLYLTGVAWDVDRRLVPGQEATLMTNWIVAQPLQLPPMPVVANPPPPGVYSGPRLAVFIHLLAPDGAFLAGDDGLWVDPLTLQPGDRFMQVHRVAVPDDAPAGPYALELGLYDPFTGERWSVLDSHGRSIADRVLLSVGSGDVSVP